ncbi:MAG TPA: hypothetical protein VF041_07765 [Gemmatimonadaceae bacterium]
MAAIAYEPLFDDVIPPERATRGAAGYDVRAYLRGRDVRLMRGGAPEMCSVGDTGVLWLEPSAIALIPLGFRARLPEGYEAQIRLRSSVAFKKGLVLPNAPGTIDADYPDEWLVMLKNDSGRGVSIEHGERIAQVVLNRFELLPWQTGEVSRSTDRTGGLGSTG